MKKEEKKSVHITLDVAPEQRAKGTKLPLGNPTILSAKSDGSKLPENLKAVWEKVEKHGNDGVKLSVLCPKTPEGKYTRWLVRTLVKMNYLKALEEPKTEKPSKTKAPKKLTIAKAAAKNKARKQNFRKAA